MQDEIKHLAALYGQGRFRDLLREAERLAPQFVEQAIFHNIRGAAHAGLGDWDAALAAYARALEIRPDYAEAHNNLGVALNDRGTPAEAVASYRRALEIKPAYAEAHNNLGTALRNRGLLDAAAASCRQALEIRPDYAEAHNNLGVTLNEAGAVDDAIACFRRAVDLKPAFAAALSNLGASLKSKGRLDEAVASYRRAIDIRPDFVEAHTNLGATLKEQGALDQAIACYRRALDLKPDHAEAHNNLGVALKNKGLLDESMASLRRALEINPTYAEAFANLGAAHLEKGQLDQAIASYDRALKIRPDYAQARARKLHQQAHICDWAALEREADTIAALGVEGEAVSPFGMLSMEDHPARHRIRAEKHAAENYRREPLPPPARPRARPARLRVGYFSADFQNHATMYLMAKLFEAHDRDRFEIFAYSYGPDANDAMRRRLVAAVDGFHAVRTMSDEAVAKLARGHGLDIAVDLKGYTQDGRPGIFAYRPAPVQVSYLGYPGTLGAPFMDYIVADEMVIPPAQRVHYSESVILLPHSYQVNDDTRKIASPTGTRSDFGLPEEGVVFCCFNNSYKIGPAAFDIWMRLLRQVEGSVLWLFKANRWAEDNLRKEAEARGVSGERIVFAAWADLPEHLARHRLADLFLDTFNYTAHTTASDALWAGLPVVTKLGQGFPARVGGSLLRAVGLSELITETPEAYERLALELARSPERLGAIKRKLADNRITQPLFDAATFTRHLEAGYEQAYRRYLDGLEPDTIRVTP